MLTLFKNNELQESSYRTINAISQSLLRDYALSPTPLHFHLKNNAEKKISSAMELGTLLHKRMELRERFFETHIDMPKGMRKGTKAHKEFKEKHRDKTLIKHSDSILLDGMYQSIMDHNGASKLLSEGFCEESFLGELQGIEVKGRLDFRNPTLKVILDIKTSLTGNPFEFKGFAKTVKDCKYEWQAAFYVEALKHITGDDYSFVFIVVEKQYPFACSLHTLEQEDIEIARREVLECLHEFNARKQKEDWGDGYGSQIYTLKIRSFN